MSSSEKSPTTGETASSPKSASGSSAPSDVFFSNIPAASGAQSRSRASDFWALMGCNAIVFGASVCIMALELTASRLIAAHLGSSLYTWTSVIGVVLAGISFGNFLGGWLADRFDARKVLGLLFLISALLTFSTLFLSGWSSAWPRPDWVEWQTWVMFIVAWIFFLPALALGTISPVTASIAIRRSVKTGMTVGNIYAWGAFGSIVGTFLAGFWLIGEFGTRYIIWMISTALLAMGAMVTGGQRVMRMFILFGALQFVTFAGLFAAVTEDGMGKFARRVAAVRSFWSTGDDAFDHDQAAIRRATDKDDQRALETARETNKWRWERKKAEEAWESWGRKLGKQLHQTGITLALRNDDPGEYNDESDYYSINVSYGSVDGDTIKQLKLDYLLHSYWNPDNPTKLHYDYERVYAAVTERAAALWGRQTEVTLASDPPAVDEWTKSLPSTITYDPKSRKLSVKGAMNFAEFEQLLSFGPHAPFWKAVLSTWQQANADWKQASQDSGGVLLVPLDTLPDGITFPDDLAVTVHYDTVLKSILCTSPFDFSDAVRLLAQGPGEQYVRGVVDLYKRSRRVSTMFIGGGGFVFPRWIENKFPDEPNIDVAEIDPAVQAAVEAELGLATEYGSPKDGKTYVRTHIGDARKFVDDQIRENERLKAAGKPPVTYEFVYGDAFNDLSVPWHLTTREFSEKVRALLTPDEGAYLVNIIDIYPRAQYPPENAKVAVAVVSFSGELPEGLVTAKISTTDWVRAKAPYRDLEVTRAANEYRLRYTGEMSKEIRDALIKLDDDGPSGMRMGQRFRSVISELHEKTNNRKLIIEPPPNALLPANIREFAWISAPGEYRGFQIHKLGKDGYLFGYRGVMSAEMRDRLIKLAPDLPDFKAAVDSLYVQSQRERVGQFLGRYVRTAAEVFPYVYVFTSNEDEPSDLRDTFVVACSMKKIEFTDLESAGGHWRSPPFAWIELGEAGNPRSFGEMQSVLELARGLALTDDFAPVDNLLAPVFVSRSKD